VEERYQRIKIPRKIQGGLGTKKVNGGFVEFRVGVGGGGSGGFPGGKKGGWWGVNPEKGKLTRRS